MADYTKDPYWIGGCPDWCVLAIASGCTDEKPGTCGICGKAYVRVDMADYEKRRDARRDEYYAWLLDQMEKGEPPVVSY